MYEEGVKEATRGECLLFSNKMCADEWSVAFQFCQVEQIFEINYLRFNPYTLFRGEGNFRHTIRDSELCVGIYKFCLQYEANIYMNIM